MAATAEEGTSSMTADRTSTVAGTTWADGAAIHPRFLRVGPWVLSLVVATLFVLSFATSYAALYDYALQLQFGREFAIVFPLVLDAVISVLAVTVLLERALRRRTIAIKGRQFALRLPTWPLFSLWIYFGGSVAGNVAHAPSILAAQLVAAVPPISAALTFHLLLRLLDRAPALRQIAEAYDERTVEEKERAALRRVRRAQLKGRQIEQRASTARPAVNGLAEVLSNGDDRQRARAIREGHVSTDRPNAVKAGFAGRSTRSRSNGRRTVDSDDLRLRVRTAVASGDRVTGEVVGHWLGKSARTGRRRLSALLDDDPALAQAIELPHADGRAQLPPRGLDR